MKITSSSDWRDALAFDTPVIVATVLPGEPTRCAGCDADVAAYSRDDLWVVKHRHPNNPAGFVRFYCVEHVAPFVRREPVAPPESGRAPSRRGASTPRERRPARSASVRAAAEKPRAVCPNCFVEVPPTGVCGMCGEQVA